MVIVYVELRIYLRIVLCIHNEILLYFLKYNVLRKAVT